MLCANLIYFDPVTFILILTHMTKYDALIFQIDLIVAEIHSVNYRAETQNRD